MSSNVSGIILNFPVLVFNACYENNRHHTPRSQTLCNSGNIKTTCSIHRVQKRTAVHFYLNTVYSSCLNELLVVFCVRIFPNSSHKVKVFEGYTRVGHGLDSSVDWIGLGQSVSGLCWIGFNKTDPSNSVLYYQALKID